MIETLVDERLRRGLQVAEVHHEPAVVEGFASDDDLDLAVVPVDPRALADVVEQPVAVAEVNDLGDLEHGPGM